MTNILVVYYSRTGFTRTIAGRIARACGADLEAIEDVSDRHGAWGYLRSAVGAVLHADGSIVRTQHDPGAYSMVLIGTPVWAGNIPGPVRTYLKSHRHQFRRVAFFCTCGGSGQQKVLGDLEALVGRPALATLAMTDDEVAGKMYSRRLSKFVARIQNSGKFGAPSQSGDLAHAETLIGL